MKKFLISLSCCVLITLSLSPLLWAGEPTKIAIIPFKLHAPDDLSYVRDGIFDMLASRIAWGQKVTVLEKHVVEDLSQKYGGSLDEASARKLAEDLKVDYVLFGSLTVLGNTSSLDAKIVSARPGVESVSVYSQAKNLDEVIPKIDEFARTINTKIFGHTLSPPTATTPPREEETATAHPQRILLGSVEGEDQPDANQHPDFIQFSAKKKKAGFWKSQEFPVVMRGMQLGDLDGDGYQEIVFINQTDIWVYRYQADKIELVKHIKGQSTYDQLSVDVCDINANGIPEIYISNLNAGHIDSFVLEWNGSDLVRIAEHLHWYLRLTPLAVDKLALIGQPKGIDSPFLPSVYELRWIDKKLEAGERISLPRGANVFNFAQADIKGDEHVETIMIDENNKLRVYSVSGELEWISDEPYGETLNFIVANPDRPAGSTEERIYLPSRIVVKDLDKNNITELIVSKNLSKTSRWLRNFKSYSSNELYSLTWDGLGLTENWKTRKISGAISDYQMVEIEEGRYAMFAGIIMRTGIAPVLSGKSTIISYELKFEADEKE